MKRKKKLGPKSKKQKWDVYWVSPETKKWTKYGSGLARTRADKLARQVTYELAPRWGYDNIPTKVVGEGDEP